MADLAKVSSVTKESVNRLIDEAIFELFEAKRFVNRSNFERAEDEIGDTIRILGKVIRKLNDFE